MIGLRAGTRIWLAAGATDMRRLRQLGNAGADGAGEEPVLGVTYSDSGVRGRRGDVVKL